jgi:hypothetical protein
VLLNGQIEAIEGDQSKPAGRPTLSTLIHRGQPSAGSVTLPPVVS